MRLAATSALAILVTGCISAPAEDQCQQSPARLAELRANVLRFLEADLGTAFVYYADEQSVTSQVYQSKDECRIYIVPAGDPGDGTTLLHGDGFVYFDPTSLEPSVFRLIAY